MPGSHLLNDASVIQLMCPSKIRIVDVGEMGADSPVVNPRAYSDNTTSSTSVKPR